MININVRVPESRDRTAVVEIRSGLSKVADGIAVASASPALAARHGNPHCDPLRPWGHPPLGSYRLLAQGPAPAGCDIEYGGHLLVFQPESGSALEAESFGRLLLLAYAGPAGKSGQLRPTQGGLRLQQKTFDALRAVLAAAPEAVLEIDVLRPPSWWQFWKRAAPTLSIAPDAPKLTSPPLDEVSLATLIAQGKRLAPRTRVQRDDDWAESRRDTDASSSSASGNYSGRGGASGGGGAGGSWDNAAGRGQGVDTAGRILTAATGAALLAGSLEASEHGGSSPVNDESSGGDTGTQTSTSY